MSEPTLPKPALMNPKATRWVLSALAAIGVAATLMLGSWQLNRAAQKLTLAQQIADKKELPALTNSALAAIKIIAISNANSQQKDADAQAESNQNNAEIASLVNRSVTLQGRWLHEHTVYLQNRQMNRLPGFYVLTPLQLLPPPSTAQGLNMSVVNMPVVNMPVVNMPVVVVQRGWVARDYQDFSKLPAVGQDTGDVQVNGRTIAQASAAFELSTHLSTDNSSSTTTANPRIRQNLKLEVFAQQTGLPILPVVVLQTDADDAGLLRAWPAVDYGVDKHYGYAFQWFAMCVLIVVLFVWFQFITPQRRARRAKRAKPAAQDPQEGSSNAK